MAKPGKKRLNHKLTLADRQAARRDRTGKSLTVKHRKAISEGLKAHHAGKKYSKSTISRLEAQKAKLKSTKASLKAGSPESVKAHNKINELALKIAQAHKSGGKSRGR